MFDNLYKFITSSYNVIDGVIIFLVAFFSITNGGLIISFYNLISFVVAFFFSVFFYRNFAGFFSHNLSVSYGLSKVIGFFSAWVICEMILYLIFFLIIKKLPKIPKNIDTILGSIPAALDAIILSSIVLSLAIALPVKADLKKNILSSKTGSLLLQMSSELENQFKGIFNDAIAESLNFLTIKPHSDETVNLGIKLTNQDLKIDNADEKNMLDLINNERRQNGLSRLSFDPKLQKASRQYAREMFTSGFFSHTSSIDGSSPAQRLERYGIEYRITGENLAFAPNLQIAHAGLMRSPGHRANILSPQFNLAGIGVIDGSVYGKIYVQEFTD